MKTRKQLPLAGRNPESGAIAFVVAAMWMVLFGLAAFAVDMGYRYQSKFGLQAAADAAVRAGMPSFVNDDVNGATTKAIAMAGANGYPSNQVTVTPSGNLFQVDISATPPSFFLGLFGSPSSFPLGATAIGEKTGGGGGAFLFANNDGGNCASGKLGITFNGDTTAPFNIKGNMQSNGQIMAQGVVDLLAGANAQTPCAGQPSGWGATNVASNITPNTSVGGPFADPFVGTTLAGVAAALGGCTYGSLTDPTYNSIPSGNWTYDGTTTPPHGVLAPGVYCSGADLTVTDTSGAMYNYAPGSVFLAVGALHLGCNNGATFQAPVTSPHKIFAMSTSNAGTGVGGQAIDIGNGNTYDIQGAIYAPLGEVNWGGQIVTMTTGAIVANEINLSSTPNLPWTIGGGVGGGGGGGGTWKMHR